MTMQSLGVSVAITLVLVLTTAISVMAADPIIGTWKLNVAKSRFSQAVQAILKEAPPKEYSEVLREVEGDQIELSGKGIQTNGQPFSFRLMWPRQGGMVTILEDVPGFTYIETLIGPGEWYVTTLQNGKQVSIRHKVVSRDGRTKQETITVTDAQGRRFEQIELFERQ
jgi:hypothetical protein